MKCNFLSKYNFIVYVLGMILLSYGITYSQDQSVGIAANAKRKSKTVFLHGTVTGINGNLFEILNGQIILDLSKARVFAPNNFDLTISDIKIGMRLDAQASIVKPQENFSMPIEIDLVKINLSNEGDIAGSIESINLNENSLTIANQKILVNDETRITKRDSNNPAIIKGTTLKGLEPKSIVFVSLKTEDGKLIATEIYPTFFASFDVPK